MSLANKIWVEKYRPRTLDDLILPERLSTKFSKELDNHILLYGSPGLGKTSLAKILSKDNPTLHVNCSLETGVDTVRTKITEFCSNISLIGGKNTIKFVILDEFDGVSDQYMKSMRGVIEKFANTTRFIATCNYINQIPDNVQSRFDVINFDFPKEEENYLLKKYMQRIQHICRLEGMEIEPKAMLLLARKNFPDLRSTITTLQSKHSEGIVKLTELDIKNFSGEHKVLYDMLLDKKIPFIDIYTFAYKNYLNNEIQVLDGLGRQFIDYLISKEMSSNLVGSVNEIVSDNMYKVNFIVDKFICLASTLNQIKSKIQ